MPVGFTWLKRIGWMNIWGWVAMFLGPALSLWAATSDAIKQTSPGQDRLPPVIRIRLEISPDQIATLRTKPRQVVPATLRAGESVYGLVGVHLKGSTGSFRPIDDKPGFTLDFSRFTRDQRFYGLSKLHLNNSVEDPSYVNEKLGSELFRAAGVPAPETSWALVELNGRALGLYVLQEGFTKEFIAKSSLAREGVLFDTDWGHDVNQRLRPVFTLGEENAPLNFEALQTAMNEPDSDQRWLRLREQVDMDRFMSFMAMEVLLGHRDGYCMARNNFRIYREAGTRRLVFLPHGMDQLLGRPDLPWRPHMAGLLARAVLESPEGSRQYRARFSALFTNLFQVETLTNQVQNRVTEVRPFLEKKEALEFQREADQVCERIVQRQANLKWQLSQPPAIYLVFTNRIAALPGWSKQDEPKDGKMELKHHPEGVLCYHMLAGRSTSCSWRKTVMLRPGRYCLQGRGIAFGVKPLPFGKHQGLCLRLEGELGRSVSLVGDTRWKPLSVEFEVSPNAEEIGLMIELRASAGEVWVDAQSLRLVLPR
jgi:spore coat protein H